MPLCNGCGASYDSNFKYCPYCGREKPEPKKVEISLTVNEAQGNNQCPSCKHSSKVYKVSGITNSRSDLQMLPKPTEPENGCLYYPGVVFILIAGLFLIIGALVNTDGLNTIDPFLFSVSFLVLGIWFVWNGSVKSSQRAKYDQNLGNWKEAKKYWDELYYCQGCDIIFLPQKGEFSAPEKMAKFLYSQFMPINKNSNEALANSSPDERTEFQNMQGGLRD